MKWFKENPFLAGLILVTVVGAGALGYLLSGAMTRYQEATDSYTQAVQKLSGLQARVPYPSQENLAKAKQLSEEYKKDFQALRDQMGKMELPLNLSVGPQQFQDDLRRAVNETAEKAAAAGVSLPEGYYLGFRQYSNSLPSEQAAPALARQLAVIKQIVQRLIDFKVQSIDKLDRMPLPQEGGAAASAAAPAGPNNRQGNNNRPQRGGGGGGEKRALERYPFDISFTSEQSKFRVAFNSLLSGDQFLIVRAVNLQNSNPVGPKIETAAPATTDAMAMPNPIADPTAESNSLNVILGRELVQATLRIEMIDFPDSLVEGK